MPEPALGRCYACDVKLSPARLRALLRRRALTRLLQADRRLQQGRSHAGLARALREVGFPATKNLVTKDLKLIGEARLAEKAWATQHLLKEMTR